MEKGKTRDVPQLSNEMQLNIMMKVKSGELSIDDALLQAQVGSMQQLQHQLAMQEKQAAQYNFSVHKFNRYRWQKRVLQLDFSTKTVCSIEKGTVKRQFPFADVKNCHDGPGTKFSISFKGRHDYELEAASRQDKEHIMQLINQIIFGNVYNPVLDKPEEIYQSPPSPKRLHEGPLLLQRGGLASFKYKKYEAHLHTGQLTLLTPGGRSGGTLGDMPISSGQPVIIHFSDGNARVETSSANDLFILRSNNKEFRFRIPGAEQKSAEAVRRERDAWVRAMDKLCKDWRRKSRSEHIYEELHVLRDPRSPSPVEEERGQGSDGERASDESDAERTPTRSSPVPVPPLPAKSRSAPTSPAGSPKAVSVPVPVPGPVSESLLTVPSVPPQPSPVPVPPSLVPVPPSLVPVPPPPVPVPPPLALKNKANPPDRKTKAFHWDVVPPDKIEKSMWRTGLRKMIEIDTSRLQEEFGVKISGTLVSTEPSRQVNILLNQKIAHNFNIFLRSFPVQPKELKDKLFIISEEDGGLSDEHIVSLRRYVPTTDDIEMYKSHKGPLSELHVVDQYMMEMCAIPYLSSRLDLLMSLRELPISMEELEPLIGQKIRMCQELRDSEGLTCVLEWLLATGNYLNENAGKPRARGLRLSSLTKLSQLRGRNRKFTLLHALVEQIMLHEPHLATFFLELAEFDSVPGASIKGLTAEVAAVKNEFQKVIQYRKTYKKKNPVSQHQKFTKDLKATIETYDASLSLLTKRCEEMRKLYSDILVKFGEPKDLDSQELFGWVCKFIEQFKKAHSELTL